MILLQSAFRFAINVSNLSSSVGCPSTVIGVESFRIRGRQSGSVPSGSTMLGPLTSITLSMFFRLNNESAGTKE